MREGGRGDGKEGADRESEEVREGEVSREGGKEGERGRER